MSITLDAFGWRAVIRPDLGGSMASLEFAGKPVLRSAGADVGDILDCASFPLVPFANRIGSGLLRFGDRTARLDRESAAWPHAHHGHGWRRSWQVAEVNDRHLTLFYDHPGRSEEGDQGWPWHYRAEQRFAIHAGGVRIDLAIINRDLHSAMPCGTGIHPYFVRRRESAIIVRTTEMWANHPDGLARALEPTDMFQGVERVPVDHLEGLDNFFPCTEPVTILGGDHAVRLNGSAMAGVHIYVPAGEDYFCIEPVSHAPDAFGRGEYEVADILAPGETFHWRWDISSAADPGR
jgi:aldose 1-epimerase